MGRHGIFALQGMGDTENNDKNGRPVVLAAESVCSRGGAVCRASWLQERYGAGGGNKTGKGESQNDGKGFRTNSSWR